MDRCKERAMVSSLSMKRMARMSELLEPIGRPSVTSYQIIYLLGTFGAKYIMPNEACKKHRKHKI